MRLSRQHFQMIADVLAGLKEEYGDLVPHDALVSRFAGALRSTNPQFSRDRFERAAGSE